MIMDVKTNNNRLIYFLELNSNQSDLECIDEVTQQVGYFGYQIASFLDITSLEKALKTESPAVIIIDWTFSQEPSTDEGTMNQVVTCLQNIHREKGEGIPIIFVSRRDDSNSRLRAVRMGGQAYFVKPVDPGTLIDTLDWLLLREQTSPYRVLIVDDSRVAARFAQSTLQKAGMTTQIVTDPLSIMSQILEFSPDLILLDMYMPECTGMELAKVIRQMEQFVSIPIVYLSSEEDKDMQLEAMSLGADDFINKMDLKRHHLIGAVQSRVERYRKLRSLMTRDSLTGLLNHTTLKERIFQEVARAKRAQAAGKEGSVSFAMLDIDHFKSVNDSYGHSVGDRVLKSLARFLQQRLRQSDTVGRYGGEEFAVILPDTGGEHATNVLNEIRENFSQIRHQTEEGDFSVTFSCGVAAFPDLDDPVKINDAADQAMYAAKRGGRNRVIYSKMI